MFKYVIIFSLFMSGCCSVLGVNCPGGKCATPGKTKCKDDCVWLCDGNRNWRLTQDCKKLKLQCVEDEEYAYCGRKQ